MYPATAAPPSVVEPGVTLPGRTEVAKWRHHRKKRIYFFISNVKFEKKSRNYLSRFL